MSENTTPPPVTPPAAVEPFDSTNDTTTHIQDVRSRMMIAVQNLLQRAAVHDASKLVEPEKSYYDRVTVRLREVKYGSEQYKEILRSELGPAIEHHYANNSHHPEFYGPAGVNGMSLFDLMEMLMDWKARVDETPAHMKADIFRSLMFSANRFRMTSQLTHILHNTMVELKWIDRKLAPPGGPLPAPGTVRHGEGAKLISVKPTGPTTEKDLGTVITTNPAQFIPPENTQPGADGHERSKDGGVSS